PLSRGVDGGKPGLPGVLPQAVSRSGAGAAREVEDPRPVEGLRAEDPDDGDPPRGDPETGMTGRALRDPADFIVAALDFENGGDARSFMDRLRGRLRWV